MTCRQEIFPRRLGDRKNNHTSPLSIAAVEHNAEAVRFKQLRSPTLSFNQPTQSPPVAGGDVGAGSAVSQVSAGAAHLQHP